MVYICRNCSAVNSTPKCQKCGGDCDFQKEYIAEREGGTGGGQPGN